MSSGEPPAPRSPALARGERAQAALVVAQAFRDNPLNVAVVGDDPERRLRANRAGAASAIASARLHGELRVAREDGRIVGVLLATPPGSWPLPLPPLGLRLLLLLRQGAAVARRWAEVFDALQALHPASPHWYLGTLGVAPARQGRGVGGALLREWLAQRAAEGRDFYLETDRERNVAFYGRAGFEVVGEATVLGVTVWRMIRPAGVASG